MTFHTNQYHENHLLKFLMYNGYAILEAGVFVRIDPKLEAFLTTKEFFNWEIEEIEVIRNTEDKIVNTQKKTITIQIQGLGIPNLESTFFTFSELKTLNTKVPLSFRKYWDNNTYQAETIASELKTIAVQENKLGLPGTNDSWPSRVLGQLLDVAVYL